MIKSQDAVHCQHAADQEDAQFVQEHSGKQSSYQNTNSADSHFPKQNFSDVPFFHAQHII